jgi:hypothetical protein
MSDCEHESSIVIREETGKDGNVWTVSQCQTVCRLYFLIFKPADGSGDVESPAMSLVELACLVNLIAFLGAQQ